MSKIIKSTDDNALEALKERLVKQEADHDEMKKRNEYFRKKGTMVGYPDMPEEKAKKLDENIAGRYSWERQPHPTWQLQNSNQEIRRTKQRIKQLEAENSREEATYNTDGLGFDVVENQAIKRLQIIFEGGGRVDKEYREKLQVETGFSLIGNDDFVFGTNKGELRSYSGTKHMFDRFLKRNNLDGKGIHFYELRHTFSNTLFEQNTNPRVVQALMGHRKIETTMIYNTVRDNKYLESAIGVFDSRYETAREAVEEPADKHKYYRAPKNKAVMQPITQPVEIVTTEQQEDKDVETIAKKISKILEDYNITDIDEFLSSMKKKSEAEM